MKMNLILTNNFAAGAPFDTYRIIIYALPVTNGLNIATNLPLLGLPSAFNDVIIPSTKASFKIL